MAKATDCKSVIYRFESGGRLLNVPQTFAVGLRKLNKRSWEVAESEAGVFRTPLKRAFGLCLNIVSPFLLPFPASPLLVFNPAFLQSERAFHSFFHRGLSGFLARFFRKRRSERRCFCRSWRRVV